MPWIAIEPNTIVMNLNARDTSTRFGITVKTVDAADNWRVKFQNGIWMTLKPAEFVPILYLDEGDTFKTPFAQIWEKYAERIHDVAYTLFAQP
jgi:hypothetical protein